MRLKTVIKKLLQSATEIDYKVIQVLQIVTDCYYKVRQVLQSVAGCYYYVRQVLQSVTVITKSDVTLDLAQNIKIVILTSSLLTVGLLTDSMQTSMSFCGAV